MDACDPGTESGNIRRLIKLHTGETVKLSRTKVCEIMKAAKENRSPLPPLGLTRDKKYLLDAKSPLTQRDYEILFKSTSKLTDIKRIAKKSGLTQLDKTISDLKGAIGRRLRSMNVREPVLLHGRATTQRASSDNKFYNLENNVNTTRNANNNNNNNGERENINSARVASGAVKEATESATRDNNNNNRNGNGNRNRNRNGNRKPNVNVAPRASQSTGDIARDLARLRHQRRLQSTGGGGGFGLGGGGGFGLGGGGGFGLGGGRIVANGMGGRRVVSNGGGSSFLRGAMSTNRITRNTSQSEAAVIQLATERREMARRMNLARQEAERLANKAAESKSASARNEARLARNRYASLRKNMNEKERETKERLNKLENEKRNTERKLSNASEKINNISAAKNNATSKLNTATKKKNLLEVKYKAAREQINEEKKLANEAVQAAKTAQLSNNQTAINEAKRAKETANAKVAELEQQFTTMKQQFNTSQREVTNLKQQATNATTKLNAAQTEVTNMKEKANKKRRNMFETLLNNFNVPMNKRMEYKNRFERGNRIGVIANELKVEAKKKKNLLEGKYKAAREQMNTNAANRKKLQENLNESKQNVNIKIIAAAREAGNQARRAAENQAQQNINRIQKNAANEKRTLENSITNAKREANELRNSTNAKIANAKQEAEAAGREAQKANNTEEMKKANNAKRNANAKVAAIEQEAKNKRKRMLEKLLNQYNVTNRQPYMNRFNQGERISVIAEEFKKQEANKIQQNKNNALREQREKNAENTKQREKEIRLQTLKKLRAKGLLVVHPNKGGSSELFTQFNTVIKKAETNGNVSSNDLKTLQTLINNARNKKTSNARTKLNEAQAKANANARAAEQRLANEKASAEKRLTNQKAAANKEMATRRIQNAFRAKQAAAKAEANAKAKANAEATAKANAEARAKANAEAKAVADRQRAFNNLLKKYPTATNDNKTEARARFNKQANISVLNTFLNIRTRTRKEAEEKKKLANKAEADKRSKAKELENLFSKYDTIMGNNSDWPISKKLVRQQYKKGKSLANIKADLNGMIELKKKEPVYINTGSPGPRKNMQTNPIPRDSNNPLFEKVTTENKKPLISAINSLKQLPQRNKTIFKVRLEDAFKNQNLNKMKAIKNEALAANKTIQGKKAVEKAKAKLLLVAKGLQSMINRNIKDKSQFPKYKRLTEGIRGLQGSNTIPPLTQKEFENISANYQRDKSARKIQEKVRARKAGLIAVKMKENIKPLKTALENEKLMMSREKKAATEKTLFNAFKNQNRSKLNQVKKIINNQRATVTSLQAKKQAMLQNIKKLNKPAQNSFVGRIPKADSAGLNMIREEINQALRYKQERNKRKLLPKAKSSNNIKRTLNKLNISREFKSSQSALATRAQKLIGQQDMKTAKVRLYLGSKWQKKINNAKTREDLRMIGTELYVREDIVKQLDNLPGEIKKSKKQKINELRSYIVPYLQSAQLFIPKLAEITGNISKMR